MRLYLMNNFSHVIVLLCTCTRINLYSCLVARLSVPVQVDKVLCVCLHADLNRPTSFETWSQGMW